MKPRTKKELEVALLSKSLRVITKKQQDYAIRHLFKNECVQFKDKAFCLQCGNYYEGHSTICPHCHKRLKIRTGKRFTSSEKKYFGLSVAVGNYQVLRFFIVSKICKKGRACEYDFFEVIQRWISEDGKITTIARPRCIGCYCDQFTYGEMSIKNDRDIYNIYPYSFKTISRTKILERNGYKGELPDLPPEETIVELLTNSKAETLMKAGQISLLRHFLNQRFRNEKYSEYWQSIKICIRNRYNVQDGSLWCDYIDLLRYFDLDTRNAKYVCPENLNAEHDRLLQKKERKEELEELGRKMKDAIKYEKKYKKDKQGYFGVSFAGKGIIVSVISSVREMAEEATFMHHCVYRMEYFKKKQSLILSAKDTTGNRLETIEVDLSTFRIIQSRGKYNQNSTRHNDIIDLVNENMYRIRKAKQLIA